MPPGGHFKEGRLIAQGSPDELRRQVGHGREPEDIFLELTAGHESAELIRSLEEVNGR